MPSVVTYSRISSDTARDGHGVEDHRKRSRDASAALGWDIVFEFTDNDISASKATTWRPGFEAVIKALSLGRLDDGTPIHGLIVTEQSRLARTHTDWERLVDALTIEPGRVYADGHAVADPYADSFELLGAVGTSMNKAEIRRIRARTKNNHRSRAERGLPAGGTRPFGWQDDRRTLDVEESAVAREIVARWLAGASLHRIACDLQDRGVTTTRDGQWTSDTLRKWLKNPRLVGWRALSGELMREVDGSPVVGQWQPLVTVAEWEQISGRFAIRQKGEVVARRHLLSGILRCGKCGTPLRAMPTKRADVKGGLLYTCPSRAAGGCGGVGRNAQTIEGYLIETVLARAEQISVSAATAGPWPGEQRHRGAQARRESLTDRWASGGLDDESYFPALDAIIDVLKGLRVDRDKWEAKQAAAATVSGNIREDWDRRHDDLDWRRRFLLTEIAHVVVLPVGGGRRAFDPDSLRIVWTED